MRVIGGEARGKNLYSVPGKTTRSITSRVKKSLFDILADDIPGCRFLDLFAGAGTVGIEALSRGARAAVLVESNSRAITTIHRNLQRTALGARASVVKDDVFHYLGKQSSSVFDIIYVAPPQYKSLWEQTLLALDCCSILCDNGVVIAQIFPKEYHPLELRSLELYDQRRYGSTLLCFYTSAVPQ